jgi:hypothetical protein
MLQIIIYSLIILSLVFFFTDTPYFFISIISIGFSFFIILIKAMWSVSVAVTNKTHQFFDDE